MDVGNEGTSSKVVYLTANDFSPGLEPITEEMEPEIKRVKEFLKQNWKKSDVSTYTRRINKRIHVIVNVHPKYEALMNQCLGKWIENQGWKLPIVVEVFDDSNLGDLLLKLGSPSPWWRFW